MSEELDNQSTPERGIKILCVGDDNARTIGEAIIVLLADKHYDIKSEYIFAIEKHMANNPNEDLIVIAGEHKLRVNQTSVAFLTDNDVKELRDNNIAKKLEQSTIKHYEQMSNILSRIDTDAMLKYTDYSEPKKGKRGYTSPYKFHK